MKYCVASITTFVILSTGVSALNLVASLREPAVVSLKTRRGDVSANRVRKRSSLDVPMENRDYGFEYTVTLGVGNPPTLVDAQVDTGSGDLWFNTPSSSFCQSGGCIAGAYDAGSSSTSVFVSNDLQVSYADGASANGSYVKDDLRFGNTTLHGFQMGTGNSSNYAYGYFGLAYPITQINGRNTSTPRAPNAPQLMAQQGLIQTPAFSLWLDSIDSTTGSILFGGVDTSKYHGTLQTLPMERDQEDNNYRYLIGNLSSVSVSNSSATMKVGNSPASPIPGVFDSGAPFTTLSEDIVVSIYDMFSVQTVQGKYGFCNCSLANDTSRTIDFNFGNVTIKTPLRDHVLSIPSIFGQLPDINIPPLPTGLCAFGIQRTVSAFGLSLLGDNFLRNAYVVFDLEDHTISVAPTNFAPTGPSKILEIGPGSNNANLTASGVASTSAARSTSSSSTSSFTSSGGAKPTTSSFNANTGSVQKQSFVCVAAASIFVGLMSML